MTRENSPDFDTRYDAAYQRGFTGAQTPARIRAVETPKQDRPERVPATPRREPARQVPAESPREPDLYDPFAVPSARSTAEAEPIDADADAGPAEEFRSAGGPVLRGNPWVATLWVVAVLLLTAGFFGTWRSQSIYVGASPITDMNEIVNLQILQLLSPSLVLVGLLVLGGLLFLHAIAWRARRTAE